MSDSKLPERASLEYLRKLARTRLPELRRTNPDAKLASALLQIAREYGFPSWRALKAQLDDRRAKKIANPRCDSCLSLISAEAHFRPDVRVISMPSAVAYHEGNGPEILDGRGCRGRAAAAGRSRRGSAHGHDGIRVLSGREPHRFAVGVRRKPAGTRHAVCSSTD